MFGTVDESGAGICVIYRVDVTGMSTNTIPARKTVLMNGNLWVALSLF